MSFKKSIINRIVRQVKMHTSNKNNNHFDSKKISLHQVYKDYVK